MSTINVASTTHKTRHATGGADALAPSDIGAVPESVVTAKGDTLVASGSGAIARLGVGTNGFVLTANSGATNGVDWEAQSGGASAATTGAEGIVQLAGDLGGTSTSASSPKVAGVQGIAYSATAPTTGQYMKASSTSAAAWATHTFVDNSDGTITVTY